VCVDKDQILIKNAELSQKLELLKSLNSKESHESNERNHRKTSNCSKIDDNEIVFKELQDELNEKNKVFTFFF
jgi:hypothetical protein